MLYRVFDGHCDTPVELWLQEKQLRSSDLAVSLDKAAGLGGYAQFFAFCTAWIETRMPHTEHFSRALDYFLAQLRREKGMTQKELAATLYVSDKAVSKWERGLSVPDISLLVPLALLIIGVVFGVVYGAYAMFWMAETLPRYYDENRICNFAQGGFHIHIPGVYYNNRNWLHVLKWMRVWCVVSMVLMPPCTAAAVLFERAAGWRVWGAVLIVYILSLFGAIVIPAKKYE